MKKQGKLRIKMEFIDEDSQVSGEEIILELSSEELKSIDSCEQLLLEGSYKTMRGALKNHISSLSKKKSEIGCLVIDLYEEAEIEGKLPFQRSKEHYRTHGYRQTMFYEGVSENSYRKVCNFYNRRVRQEDIEGLIPSSLRYELQAEAKQIESNYEKESQQILLKHDFDDQGQPLESKEGLQKQVGSIGKSKIKAVKLAFKESCEQAPDWLAKELQLEFSDYEDQASTIYIGIDDVCNKRQKKEREKTVPDVKSSNERSGGKKKYKKRKFLFHTVIKVITNQGNYTLTNSKLGLVWPLLIALLLHNNFMKRRWIFLVDGQRSLHEGLTKRLKWKPLHLLLDWYHLRKKIHMQLYMAVSSSEQRDDIMLKLEQLAWHGLSQQAISFIQQIPEKLIKKQKALDVLIGYFERNEKLIPNYAVRKKLGLVCSSNRVEKENDFIISARQKHNGMSWTRSGSNAMATIAALKRNKQTKQWIENDTISLSVAAA